MSKDGKRLGRGLASLVSTEIMPSRTAEAGPSDVPRGTPVHIEHPRPEPTHPRFTMISVGAIRPNPAQPRKTFDQAGLEALAESMRRRGPLQPIVVRPAEGGYELIAGERRLRAAAMAGMDTIPAIIRAVRDEDILELALIENIQREDLNPVERARAYLVLKDQYGLSPEEIGKRTGEDRATVSNILRLLELDDNALALLASGKLSIGHAKGLLSIDDKTTRHIIISRIVEEGLSVRQVEALAAKLKSSKGKPPEVSPKGARPAVSDMEKMLSEAAGTKVSIREGRKRHSGRITIEYYTLDDFERIVAKFGVSPERT